MQSHKQIAIEYNFQQMQFIKKECICQMDDDTKFQKGESNV